MSDTTDRLANVSVRFARSATRRRISKDSIRYVIAHYRIRFEEPPLAGEPGARSIRIVYLGDDAKGQALEVMVVKLEDGDLLMIHAMPLRKKYRKKYEEVGK
jgi:hypothetical protein